MAHGRRRQNAYGRQVLVDRVLRQGRSVAAAAETLQVSRLTAYRRLRERPPIARRRPEPD